MYDEATDAFQVLVLAFEQVTRQSVLQPAPSERLIEVQPIAHGKMSVDEHKIEALATENKNKKNKKENNILNNNINNELQSQTFRTTSHFNTVQISSLDERPTKRRRSMTPVVSSDAADMSLTTVQRSSLEEVVGEDEPQTNDVDLLGFTCPGKTDFGDAGLNNRNRPLSNDVDPSNDVDRSIQCPFCTRKFYKISRLSTVAGHLNVHRMNGSPLINDEQLAAWRLLRCKQCETILCAKGAFAHTCEPQQKTEPVKATRPHVTWSGPSPKMDTSGSAKQPRSGIPRRTVGVHMHPLLLPQTIPTPKGMERYVRTERFLYADNVHAFSLAFSGRCSAYLAAYGTVEEIPRLVDLLDITPDLLPRLDRRLNPRRRKASQKRSIENKQQDIPQPNTVENLPASVVDRVNELALHGFVRRAAQTLCSEMTPPLKYTPEIISELHRLHPQGPTTLPASPLPSFTGTFTVNMDDLQECLRSKLSRGAAPGWDGLTREILIACLENQVSQVATAHIIAGILSGRYDVDGVRDLFTTSRLIALLKPPDTQGIRKIRPIAIEGVFLRLASHMAITSVAPSLSGRQFGVGVGCERCIHEVREFMEAHPSHTLLLFDFANAFNSLCRSAMLTQLFGRPSLAPLFRLAHFCYGHPSQLRVLTTTGIDATLSSSQGIRQGSVSGPLFFATAVDDMLGQLEHIAGSESRVFSYLDDLTVAVPISSAPKVIEWVATTFATTMNLTLSPTKCVALTSPRDQQPLQLSTTHGVVIPSTSRCVRLLGAPFGWDTPQCKEFCINVANRHNLFFARLALLHPLMAMRILAACGTPRMVFLARTTPPEIMECAAAVFDAKVTSAFYAIARITTNASKPLSPIVNLPLRLGGLGLRSLTSILRVAYEAGSAGLPGLQHDLTLENEIKVAADFAASSPSNAAWLRSCRSPSANLCFTSACTVSQFAKRVDDQLPCPQAARFMLRLRAQHTVTPVVLRCRCHRLAHTGWEHALHCSKFNKTHPHDDVLEALQAELTEMRIPSTPKTAAFQGDTQERPDLLVVLDDRWVALDVSLVHATSREATRCESAARHVEHIKVLQNKRFCASRGYGFAPVVLETTGAVGPKTHEFLMKIAAAVSSADSQTRNGRVAQMISILQRAMWNAHAAIYAKFLLESIEGNEGTTEGGETGTEEEGETPRGQDEEGVVGRGAEAEDGRVQSGETVNVCVRRAVGTGDEERRSALEDVEDVHGRDVPDSFSLASASAFPSLLGERGRTEEQEEVDLGVEVPSGKYRSAVGRGNENVMPSCQSVGKVDVRHASASPPCLYATVKGGEKGGFFVKIGVKEKGIGKEKVVSDVEKTERKGETAAETMRRIAADQRKWESGGK